jgi:hypothetical protein
VKEVKKEVKGAGQKAWFLLRRSELVRRQFLSIFFRIKPVLETH